MKIKSLIISGLCAVAMVMVGCTDSVSYSPAAPDVNDGVYFPTSDNTNFSLTNGQSEITVKLFRSNVEEAIVVPLGNNASSEFTVPSTVAFAAGQDEAEITIGVDFASIEANKTYAFQLQIAPEFASTYGVSDVLVQVLYAPWSEWVRLGESNEFGTYTYNNPFVAGDEEAAVYMRTSLDDPNKLQYRVGDYDVEGIPEKDQTSLSLMGYMPYNQIIEYDKTTGYVTVPVTNCVTTYGGSAINCGDVYTFGTQIKPSFIEGIDPEKVKQLAGVYDEETGVFAMNMVYWNAGLTYNSGNKYEYLQLPGFTQYSVGVTLNGKYTSQAGDAMQVFNITKSETVATVKYQVYAGSLSEAAAEGKAGELATNENAPSVTASGNVAVTLENGSYTIVVAGVDAEGELKAWDYLTFNFSVVEEDPNEGWTSLGEVLYGEDYFATVFSGAGVSVTNYMVECQQNDEYDYMYRLVDPYGQAWPYYGAFTDIENTAKHNYLEFCILNANVCMVWGSEMTLSVGGDEVFMSSIAFNNYAGGQTLQEQIEAGLMGKLENNKFTMPTKSLIWWIGEQGYYGNSNGGFQVNFAPEEEEEEPAAYSPKAFTAKVKAAVNSRMHAVKTARNFQSMTLDNKTWFNYKGNKTTVERVSL
ncbi:MAG: hypothetical protein K2M94_07640 [Paramuribaculum sp.]|nr:hypothetical protein [Paramuribaculum sp.]